MQPTELLYLFGGGHVGRALVKALSGTRFEVHILDDRPAWLDERTDGLPHGTVRHCLPWEEAVDLLPLERAEHLYVAIMTYSHAIDDRLLRAVLGKPMVYLGMIGSRTKWKIFSRELLADGFTQSLIESVHCPLGLPIGGSCQQPTGLRE